MSTSSLPVKFCFRFINNKTGEECTHGAKCHYSHNLELYMKTYDLKKCPGFGCGKFCKTSSKFCKNCVAENLSSKFCFQFFGLTRECSNKECPYSHDSEKYMAAHDLKLCPADCGKYCKTTSYQCAACTNKTFTPATTKFCFKYFGADKHCEHGDECHYSHDEDAYMTKNDLKWCPGCEARGVKNPCKTSSKECRRCTLGPNHKCRGCGEHSEYDYCKDCKEANDRYIVRR